MPLGRLDFDYQLVFDKQVEAKTILDHDALVFDRYRPLTEHIQAIAPQAFIQESFVHILKQTRPQIAMQPIAFVDTMADKLLDLHRHPFLRAFASWRETNLKRDPAPCR